MNQLAAFLAKFYFRPELAIGRTFTFCSGMSVEMIANRLQHVVKATQRRRTGEGLQGGHRLAHIVLKVDRVAWY